MVSHSSVFLRCPFGNTVWLLGTAVTLDFKLPSFEPGRKNFERVVWALTNKLNQDFNFVFVCQENGTPLAFSVGQSFFLSFLNACPVSPFFHALVASKVFQETFSGNGVEVTRVNFQGKKATLGKINVPTIDPASLETLSGEDKYVALLDLHEWFGLVAVRGTE